MIECIMDYYVVSLVVVLVEINLYTSDQSQGLSNQLSVHSSVATWGFTPMKLVYLPFKTEEIYGVSLGLGVHGAPRLLVHP